jgi:hypothetical protein
MFATTQQGSPGSQDRKGIGEKNEDSGRAQENNLNRYYSHRKSNSINSPLSRAQEFFFLESRLYESSIESLLYARALNQLISLPFLNKKITSAEFRALQK